MGEGPSYLPTVREAFDRLVAWVEAGAAPPPSQTVAGRRCGSARSCRARGKAGWPGPFAAAGTQPANAREPASRSASNHAIGPWSA